MTEEKPKTLKEVFDYHISTFCECDFDHCRHTARKESINALYKRSKNLIRSRIEELEEECRLMNSDNLYVSENQKMRHAKITELKRLVEEE